MLKIKHYNILNFFKIIVFHFMMESRTEIKKIGWATDGSVMKFFKIILF